MNCDIPAGYTFVGPHDRTIGARVQTRRKSDNSQAAITNVEKRQRPRRAIDVDNVASPPPGTPTWIETRHLERWRDHTGRKRSRRISATHAKQKARKP